MSAESLEPIGPRCPTCQEILVSGGGPCSNCGASVTATTTLPPNCPDASNTSRLIPGGIRARTIAPAPLTPKRPTRWSAVVSDQVPVTSAEPPHLKVGEHFGSRYRVMRLLGVGGMGAVYQAWDSELGMAVALKVIQPPDGQVTADLQRQFKNELLLARQVTHKNVIRIHDIGEVNGTKYISMPFIDGADLASVLRARGELPIPEALALMRQIAAGLAAAHEAGVVHRDLKPANILVQRGQAIITDFGIAQPMSVPAQGIIGTPIYMAPEQARGDPIDHRTDLYAFGLILFELLTGKRWNDDVTLRQSLSLNSSFEAAFRDYTPQGTWPAGLDRVLARCLALEPDRRFESAAVLVRALGLLDDTGAAIKDSTFTHAPVSVLILDVDNRTGDAMIGAIAESALAEALEQAPFIHVYPKRDAELVALRLAPGRPLDLERARMIAHREGITILLQGSIGTEGMGFRVTMNLIDPIPGTAMAIESTVAPSRDDLLRALAFVGAALREDLGDKQSASHELSGRETFTASSLEAASAYSEGQIHLSNGRYAESVPCFEKATSLDPEFGRAYCSWAVSAYYLGQRDETERLYKRAFSLMDRMSERERLRTYGTYYLTVAQAYQEAITTYTRLVDEYPADRAGHGNLAVAHFYQLNFRKAFDAGRRALALYPSNPRLRNNVALYAMYSGDFDTAAQEARSVLKTDPSYARAYVPLAVAAVLKGAEPAHPYYAQMASTSDAGRARAVLGLADLAMYEGRHRDVVKDLTTAIESDRARGDGATAAMKSLLLAEAHLVLGSRTRAVTAARLAIELGRSETLLFGAARVMAHAGRPKAALDVARQLGRRTESYNRAYANIVRAEVALARGEPADAIDSLRLGQQSADLWLINFLLGVAYIRASQFPQAVAAFDISARRFGEATCIFLDDVPTLRYLAPLAYWQARAQEGLGLTAQAVRMYQQFLLGREHSSDRLIFDARQRLTHLSTG